MLFDSDSDSSHSSTDPSTETFSNLRKVKKKRKVRSSVLKEVLNKHKLPDKSLSKKIKLPINKRISRSCMPLKVRKICKIKKKPVEKPKIKPSPRSLNRKKFSNPKLFKRKKKKKKPSSISESDPEIKGDEKEMEKFLEEIKGPKSYDPVTPQMLVDVLQSPLLHRFGATIDMIIRKLKTRKKTFQSSPKNLKEEVKKKLDIAKKLSIVEEDGGHYWITDVFKLKKLTPQKVSAFWKLYGKNCMMPGCAKPRKNTSKYLSLKN